MYIALLSTRTSLRFTLRSHINPTPNMNTAQSAHVPIGELKFELGSSRYQASSQEAESDCQLCCVRLHETVRVSWYLKSGIFTDILSTKFSSCHNLTTLTGALHGSLRTFLVNFHWVEGAAERLTYVKYIFDKIMSLKGNTVETKTSNMASYRCDLHAGYLRQ
jgi:hypothetical protein